MLSFRVVVLNCRYSQPIRMFKVRTNSSANGTLSCQQFEVFFLIQFFFPGNIPLLACLIGLATIHGSWTVGWEAVWNGALSGPICCGGVGRGSVGGGTNFPSYLFSLWWHHRASASRAMVRWHSIHGWISCQGSLSLCISPVRLKKTA